MGCPARTRTHTHTWPASHGATPITSQSVTPSGFWFDSGWGRHITGGQSAALHGRPVSASSAPGGSRSPARRWRGPSTRPTGSIATTWCSRRRERREVAPRLASSRSTSMRRRARAPWVRPVPTFAATARPACLASARKARILADSSRHSAVTWLRMAIDASRAARSEIASRARTIASSFASCERSRSFTADELSSPRPTWRRPRPRRTESAERRAGVSRKVVAGRRAAPRHHRPRRRRAAAPYSAPATATRLAAPESTMSS